MNSSGKLRVAAILLGAALFSCCVHADDEEGACNQARFEAAVKKARAPAETAWKLASASGCLEQYAAFVELAPTAPVGPLIVVAESEVLPASEQLSLLEWLVGEEALAHVSAAGRTLVAARVQRKYLDKLLETGLVGRAIEAAEGLPVESRERVFNPDSTGKEVEVDGRPLVIGRWPATGGIELDLAAAYGLVGNMEKAEKAFADSGALIEAARTYLDCHYERPGGEGCKREPNGAARALFLDHFLRRANADPYPLVETFLSSWSSGELFSSVTWSEITCRTLDAAQRGLCRKRSEYIVDKISDEVPDYQRADVERARRILGIAGIEAVKSGAARFRLELAEVAARHGGPVGDRARSRRSRVTPAPSRFIEFEIPEAYRGPAPDRASSWHSRLTPLPAGFQLVRAEREGGSVVAISVSQNYDPTGEVSRGGYWVHISSDEGKTWQPPLYTGLADRFPYVVAAASKMRMLGGDVLRVAVQVREVDTATITYPPVSLGSARQADDLYLEIPLVDLRRDTDGDGMTDIAEERLLLRPDQADRWEVPVFVNGNAPACTEPGQLEVIAKLLVHLFGKPTGAIIEPLDRSKDDLGNLQFIFEGVDGGGLNAMDRPIFLEGNPADFACLRAGRMVIVYQQDDMVRLERRSPDFHATRIEPIVYNRARNRGFVEWDTGWSGGTARLIKAEGGWTFEIISSWIT